jgi:hypothetical protein
MGVSDVGVTSSPNKKTNKNRKGASGPSAQPAFQTRERSQRFWGGDGTVVSPDSVRVTLPYEEVLLPTTSSGGLYSYQYRGNSAFDPNYTGTGGQPAGFDQWAAFYNEYTVLSSRIHIEIISGTSGTTEYCVFPSYNTTVPATPEDASVRPFAKANIGASGGNGALRHLRQSMSSAQLLGVRKEAIIDDDAYGATVGTNPAATAVWYWTIVGQNLNNSNSLADILRVHLEFDVEFHDRISLSLSSRTPSVGSSGAAAAAAFAPPTAVDLSDQIRTLMSAVQGSLQARTSH